MLAWMILSLLLALASAAGGAYWIVANAKIQRARRSFTATSMVPTTSPVNTGLVRVVVPAHNEADHIATLVRSLRAQEGVESLGVTLALDRCTDGTAEAARKAIGGDHRFEIVEIEACPEGWAGKVHAVHAGATRSRFGSPEWWVFTDADTEMAPTLLATTVRLAQERGDGLVSLLSTLRIERWFEKIVQPMSGLELGRQFPLERASLKETSRRRAFANGQFMLFDRATYEAVGGHEGVKDTLLEDMAFAEKVKDAGIGAAVYTANGMHRCAMYDSWPEFTRGWARIYTECAKRKVSRLRRHAWHTRATNTVVPLVGLASFLLGASLVLAFGAWWAWAALVAGAFAAAAWFVAMRRVAALSGTPGVWSCLGWFGAWRTGGILLRAARDLERGNPTEWGGKAYTREKR